MANDKKNERLIVPRGNSGNVGDGWGWTLNFANPYAAPLLIFTIGIIPTLLWANIYTVPIFIFLVILPFIIRLFGRD